MDINKYQDQAVSTAVYGIENNIIYPTLGLAGEAGEVANKVKKVIRDNDGKFSDDKRKELAKEIGDVMWYCAALSRDLGYNLEEVAAMNLDKLFSRRDRGMLHGSGDNR